MLVGPGLFHHHLGETGEDSPTVLQHVDQAFATSFAISLFIATGLSLVAAFLVSWFIVRRVAQPVADSESSRSRLLSDLAHELPTPLATLVVDVDGLKDGVVAGDAHSYATMREQIGRLRRLSDDLRHKASVHPSWATRTGSLVASLANEIEPFDDGCSALCAEQLSA